METLPQLNQEKNLTLESGEASEKITNNLSRQKELESNAEVVEKDGKNFFKFKTDSEESKEYQKLKQENHKDLETIINISEYKNLATSKIEDEITPKNQVGNNIDELKKAKIENEQEIQKLQTKIEDTKSKLNELRGKLGMPYSEDIPSLIDKKQKLENLLFIQNDLESKLKFENQKEKAQNEENSDNTNIENKNLNENIQEILNSIKELSVTSKTRSDSGYKKLFKNEESLSSLKNTIPDNPSIEDYNNLITKLDDIFSEVEDGGSVNDNPDSLRKYSKEISIIANTIKEQISKIKSQEERKRLALQTDRVYQNLNSVSSFLIKKAQALEAYLKQR